MRILVDIVHPADVLFFKRPIEAMLARGDEILILSRHKDIACALLDGFGFRHRAVSTAGSGLVGLGSELVRRTIAIAREALSFQPDVMIGFGGAGISHAGKLVGIPAIGFYDSENATLQTRITWPFITHLYVPTSYSGPTPKGRTTRLRGTKDMSFMHPSAFVPDRAVAIEAGMVRGRDNFFVRVVAWRANHDLGKTGWTPDLLTAVVGYLAQRGKVHLSCEGEAPEHLKEHVYRGRRSDVHHLLASCRMMVGESATMACEAGILGVPAIYAGRDFPGYTQEMHDVGLIRNLRDIRTESVISAISEGLSRPASDTVAVRDRYVRGCPDWAAEVVAAVDRHAKR